MTHTFATGAAFLDRSGALVAADAGFLARLGLPPDDPTRALGARADASPALRALLAGEGPAVARIEGDGGAVELERVPAPSGALLLVRSPLAEEWLEHSIRSQGLTRLVVGVAHDIKNPLNAMALQLALLTDKLAGNGEAAAASAGHLGALREQIGRVNEVVRRFLDVTDPSAPLGYTDLGALVADIACLYGHDARRRRIELAADAPRASVRTRCDPGRAARLVLALFSRAMSETPEGGRMTVRAATEAEHAVVALEHSAGDPDPETGYYTDVVAAAADALGGALAVQRKGGTVGLTLYLPRNERA